MHIKQTQQQALEKSPALVWLYGHIRAFQSRGAQEAYSNAQQHAKKKPLKIPMAKKQRAWR
ncbi:MAG: hypothetical protein HC913_07555 [Microscillaceae bacterium]|nr:hypothetical protein [Microscillaceae bacterium]